MNKNQGKDNQNSIFDVKIFKLPDGPFDINFPTEQYPVVYPIPAICCCSKDE